MQENNYKAVCAMIKNPFDVIQTNGADLPRPDFAFNLSLTSLFRQLKTMSFLALEFKLALPCTKSRLGNIFFIQTHTPSLHLNLTASYPDVPIRTMDLSKRESASF